MVEKEPLVVEVRPDYDLQLDYILDDLSKLKEEGLIKEEDVRRFLTTRDLIARIEDKKKQEIEKAALLKQYRHLIKSKQPQ